MYLEMSLTPQNYLNFCDSLDNILKNNENLRKKKSEYFDKSDIKKAIIKIQLTKK